MCMAFVGIRFGLQLTFSVLDKRFMRLSKFQAISVVNSAAGFVLSLLFTDIQMVKETKSLLTVKNKRTCVLRAYSRNVCVYLLFTRKVAPSFVLQICLNGS